MRRNTIIFTSLIILTIVTFAIAYILPGLLEGVQFPVRTLHQLFYTLLAITIIYTIFMLLERAFRKQITDDKTKYTATKVLSVLEILFMLIAVASIWVKDPQGLVVFFGIVGAGIAIALGVSVVIAIDIANLSARRAFELSTESVTGKAIAPKRLCDAAGIGSTSEEF